MDNIVGNTILPVYIRYIRVFIILICIIFCCDLSILRSVFEYKHYFNVCLIWIAVLGFRSTYPKTEIKWLKYISNLYDFNYSDKLGIFVA